MDKWIFLILALFLAIAFSGCVQEPTAPSGADPEYSDTIPEPLDTVLGPTGVGSPEGGPPSWWPPPLPEADAPPYPSWYNLCSNDKYSTSYAYHIPTRTYEINLENEQDLIAALEAEGDSALQEISDLDCLESFGFYATETGPEYPIADIFPLSSLTNLKNLYLSDTRVSNFSPIEGLSKLERLSLDELSISDLSFMQKLTKLNELTLWGNPISDLSPLTNLTGMKKLNLGSTLISDVRPLSGMDLIRIVLNHQDKAYCPGDCDALQEMFPNAEILCGQLDPEVYNSDDDCIRLITGTAVGGGSPSSSGGLEGICSNDMYSADYPDWTFPDGSKLVMLTTESVDKLRGEIEKNGNSALDEISDLDCLEQFVLQANDASVITDVSALSNLKKLKRVVLDYASISDLSPLSELPLLEDLFLKENNVSDLSPLENIETLDELELSSNPVSDLSPLSGLPGLRWLWVIDTPVSDVSPLADVPLRSLYLNNTNVSDVSSLYGKLGFFTLDLTGSKVPAETCSLLKENKDNQFWPGLVTVDC